MNIKKIALALFPLLLAFASCMNMSGSSGKEGAIRVALPESSSRGATQLSKSNPLYEVSLMQGDKTLETKSSESTGGGDIVFDELEPGTYKIVVTARQQDGTFLARNSAEVEVTAGETKDCPITLILAGDNGKVFSSDYYVIRVNSGSSSSAEFFDSPSSITTPNMTPDDAFEDINGDKYYININEVSSPNTGLAFEIFKNNTNNADYTITIKDASRKFEDSHYYDTINNSLWLGAVSSNEFYLINEANKIDADDNYSTPCTLSGLSIYPNATYTAFAANGTELYIAYTNDGTSYLQRAKIEGENDSFTITAIGNPQSTQDLGVDGTITDIVIHYDGYVYVLVSQTGSQNFTDMYMVNNLKSDSTETTVYSRGAVVRLEPTSNGFKVSAKTGWTENLRIIASSNKDKNTFTTAYENKQNYTFYDVNAYIPEYAERNSHFYGPRSFVAIKPKELAIADCGANIVMPDYESKKRGKLFKHNRIIKVDLYKFALESSSIIDLNNINFSNLSLSGLIESVTGFTNLTDSDEK